MSQQKEAFKVLTELFVPQKNFSRADWLKLITYYLEMVKPHLNYFTLEQLGKHSFIPYSDSVILEEEMTKGVIANGKDRLLLQEQGLFFLTPRSDSYQIKKDEGRVERVFWGVLRNHKIIMGTLIYECKTRMENDEKIFAGIGRLFHVLIEHKTLEDVLIHYPEQHLHSEDNGPSYMWWQLTKAIKDFANRRLSIYEIARDLNADFEEADKLLKYVGANKITT